MTADVATRSGRWPAGAQQLQAAFDRLDRECVRRDGFRLPATPEASFPVPEDESAAIDLDGRRRHGYGISTPAENSTTATEPDTYTSRLSTEERKRLGVAQFGPGSPRTAVTLNGNGKVTVPAAGCVASARKELAGNVQTWARIYYTPQQFDDKLDRMVPEDSGYRAALGRWRACMKKAGYTYASPDAAKARLRQGYGQGPASPTFGKVEISVAVADGKCEIHTHLPTTMLQARRRLVARLPTDDLAFLRSVATSWQAAVLRARSALTPSD